MIDYQQANPVYIAIDLKSYYASVECVERRQNPLTFNLLVADESRSDKTICLAVSPSLKAIGVPSRPRLFEAKQAISLYEAQYHTKVNYVIAKPQMALYEKVSAKIYSIYLRYVTTCDIHVYSIDEVFIEATHYMTMYKDAARKAGMDTPHYLAMTMIRDPCLALVQYAYVFPMRVYIERLHGTLHYFRKQLYISRFYISLK